MRKGMNIGKEGEGKDWIGRKGEEERTEEEEEGKRNVGKEENRRRG
jgi:hypothetical protein